MNNFVQIPDNFNPKISFDKLNPQIKYVHPFAELYKNNKLEVYDKLMWACTFMCHPDDAKNKLYRLSEEERKIAITENYYPKLNWDDKIFQECLEQYPYICLTSVQRALKDEKEFLLKRGLFLKHVVYDMDTMKDIDLSVSKTAKIYEGFEQLEEKYLNEKAKGSEVYGGRQETLAEQRKL